MHSLRLFLSWPAGASLLYLLSAACLLGGAGLVLGPVVGDEAHLSERLTMLATVAVYVGCLGGLTLLVCRWQAGNHDAVALLVLLALFLPGMHAVLSTVANQLPFAALLLGIGAVVLSLVLATRIARRVTGIWPWQLVVPLVALLLWNGLAPGLLGLAYARDVRPETLLDTWRPGWTCVILATCGLAWASDRARPGPSGPLVAAAGLRWILAGVVGVASLLHQWLLTYACNLGVTFWDLLALPLVLLLTFDVLARRHAVLSPMALAAVEGVLGLICSWAAASGDFTAIPSQPAALACYPPLLIGIASIALLGLAWRHQAAATAGAACLWLLGCVATWGVTADMLRLNTEALDIALFGLAALAIALPFGLPRLLAIIAAMVVIGGAALHPNASLAVIAALSCAVAAWRARSWLMAILSCGPLLLHGLPAILWLVGHFRAFSRTAGVGWE